MKVLTNKLAISKVDEKPSQAYLEPCQTCKMESLTKMTIFRCQLFLQGSEYTSKIQQSLHKKWSFLLMIILSKCDQIRRKLRIWSYLMKKSLMENFIFCEKSNIQKR